MIKAASDVWGCWHMPVTPSRGLETLGRLPTAHPVGLLKAQAVQGRQNLRLWSPRWMTKHQCLSKKSAYWQIVDWVFTGTQGGVVPPGVLGGGVAWALEYVTLPSLTHIDWPFFTLCFFPSGVVNSI